MAKRNKTKKVDKPGKENGSIDNKKRVIGVIMVVVAIIVFLSIISYSAYDRAKLTNQFSDIFSIENPEVSNPEVNKINNWMGVGGAYISHFFIKATFGYFSIVFPFLLFLWGVTFFLPLELKKKLKISNLSVAFSIIISTFFGILSSEYEIFSSTDVLSGAIGTFIGKASGLLLGGIGSLLLLLAITVTILVFSFNFRVENFFFKTKDIIDKTSEAGKEKLNSLSKQTIIKSKDEKRIEEPTSAIEETQDTQKKSSFLERIMGEREYQTQELNRANESEEQKQEEPSIKIVRDRLPITNETEQKETDKPEQDKETSLEKETTVSHATDSEEIIEEGAVNESPISDYVVEPANRHKQVELPEQWEETIKFNKPTIDLLTDEPVEDYKIADEELTKNAELLKDKLQKFDIEIQDIRVKPGPVVTLYEIVPSPGVKISKIVSLENDIALALAAKGIRIIAPIPGKSAIGVEIPNQTPSLVVAKSVIRQIDKAKAELPLGLGKDISGEIYITDLAKMPHLLIAGSTGSGKSVGINMILASLLYSKDPSEVKFAIIDPKKIELSFYNKLKHHFLAVSPDLSEDIVTMPQNAVVLLKSVEYEMERRYDKLAKAGVRNIVDYNIKVSDPTRKPKDTDQIKHFKLPYIIIIIDELADLMITAGKEVEEPIARLAQLARAVGIHLVLATQRPSVNVITGVIKANFGSRIAYQVASKIDSRTILDMNGAQQLLGRGDMLFLPGGTPKPVRIQNAFISTEEVEKITDFISSQKGYSKPYFLPSLIEKKQERGGGLSAELDPLFYDAAMAFITSKQASVSLLQRKLKLGYSRAARIVDQLEEAGVVGPNDGSKARELLVDSEDALETIIRNL
ncbi:MAG TPA: DNA translocase FtsK 4TM domain-containing protein [Ignavibacteriaceae bacterium]|nr:DNA translocase FtsK 4TM domain-containing protein [Ignavibacteriaceae bacterium]